MFQDCWNDKMTLPSPCDSHRAAELPNSRGSMVQLVTKANFLAGKSGLKPICDLKQFRQICRNPWSTKLFPWDASQVRGPVRFFVVICRLALTKDHWAGTKTVSSSSQRREPSWTWRWKPTFVMCNTCATHVQQKIDHLFFATPMTVIVHVVMLLHYFDKLRLWAQNRIVLTGRTWEP